MIVVNLFGGPGSGKSTGAAYVFSRLRQEGVPAELVTEFAKDLVWERSDAIRDQVYVFANQYHRLQALQRAGVTVAVTDSPLLLSLLYARNDPAIVGQPDGVLGTLKAAAVSLASAFENRNYRVKRVNPFVRLGRNETEAEANAIDDSIPSLLVAKGGYVAVDGGTVGYERIVQDVLAELKERGLLP